MTKVEALAAFKEQILPQVQKQYGKDDKPAVREAWNDYTDALCKYGDITPEQYHTWTNPF